MKQRWLYLSYVGVDGKFLGCAYVSSNGKAPFGVHGLPASPIGEIAIIVIPDKLSHNVPADHKYHDVLLSKEQLKEIEKDRGGIVNARGVPQ